MKDKDNKYKWSSVFYFKKSHLRHISEPFYALCGLGGDPWAWDDEKPHCKKCEKALEERING